MKNRRSFLKILSSWALALPFAPGFAGFAPSAVAAAPSRATAGAAGFFIVNGWVLTRADLDALKLDAL